DSSGGRGEDLKELLGRIQLGPQEFDGWQDFLRSDAPVGLTVAPLDDSSSVSLADGLLHLVTENQLFGQRIRQTRRRQKQKTDAELVIRDLSELKPGAPVRSEEHTSELQSRENLVCRILREKK